MKLVRCKKVYYFFCLVIVIAVSGVRSGPVFGKLDFILLDGRPWWKPWRPMIEQVLKQGEQPILSDMITSSVLRAVFAQQAVAFRFDNRFGHIDIEWLLAFAQQRSVFPVGGIFLLLNDDSKFVLKRDTLPGIEDISIKQLMIRLSETTAKHVDTEAYKNPYRCLINLHGFASSWVPVETGHWSWKWAEPSLVYEFKGKRGKEMKQLLRDDPPEKCTVYF